VLVPTVNDLRSLTHASKGSIFAHAGIMTVKRWFSESCSLVVLLPGGYLYSPDVGLGVAFGFREKSRVQRVGIIIIS